jgi:amino acid adenylation domain-containing protein
MVKLAGSYHQERLWFIDQFERGTLYEDGPVYHNLSVVLELTGSIDDAVLTQSLNLLVERHEPLRTRIVQEDEKLLQQVESEITCDLQRIDYKGANNRDAILDFCVERVEQPFALAVDFLFRAEVFRPEPQVHVLILTVHHILADRASMKILAHDLADIYKALANNQTPQLSELALQYADFAQWQKELTSDTLEPLLFYWKEKLSHIEKLKFFTDRHREEVHIYEAARSSVQLDATLGAKIEALEGEDFDAFIAGFKVLMHQYTDQNEIVVGTSAANRKMAGLDQVIGPVENLMVLKDTFEKEQSFLTTLQQIATNRAQTEKYDAMPFDRLVTELNPKKDMSRTALFDVLINFEDQTQTNSQLSFGTATARTIETNTGAGKYDFNLLIVKNEAGFCIHLTYNKLYYDNSTAERLLEHYVNLLQNAVGAVNTAISSLDYITEESRSAYLSTANKVNYPTDATIVSLIQEQVAIHGERIAIVHENVQMNYNDLDKISNQFTQFLISEKNVKAHDYVALLLPRGELQIPAIVSVLKTGAAYVPIDPDYPQERIDYTVQDCGANVVIDSALIAEFWVKKDEFDPTLPAVKIAPNDVAYVIYTSGSTGTPKGVEVEHRNVVRLLKTDAPLFQFNEQDVWTHFHSYCFDFSVWEMYGALVFGGKVVVVPKEVAQDTKQFAQLLQNEGVTVLNQTPSAFYNLLTIKPWETAASTALRYVIFGGEKLLPSKLKTWKEAYPKTQLINMYGITETTVHVTYKEITDNDIECDVSNIGVPIPTLTCMVVDANGKLRAPLIPGELWVGGEGVARGYLNRTELSAEKFIDNPFGEGKVYRSGDKVRMLSNGELEYMGRIDDQVKIRGFRIELGEIENALVSIENIEEAVVTLHENAAGEASLAAYIKGSELNVKSLRNQLKSKLPDYMIPGYFIELEILPLTANGKIDKEQLPSPEDASLSAGEEYVAASSDVEKQLLSIWSDVLAKGEEEISMLSDFFELGGDSLRASRLINKINSTFESGITIKDLFLNSNVADLAKLIEVQQWFTQEVTEADQATAIRI